MRCFVLFCVVLCCFALFCVVLCGFVWLTRHRIIRVIRVNASEVTSSRNPHKRAHISKLSKLSTVEPFFTGRVTTTRAGRATRSVPARLNLITALITLTALVLADGRARRCPYDYPRALTFVHCCSNACGLHLQASSSALCARCSMRANARTHTMPAYTCTFC